MTPYGTWLLSFKKLGLLNNLLLEHVGLPHVLDLAVQPVNFFGWVIQGDHSESLLLLALLYQSTQGGVGRVGWGGCWVVAHVVILVSALGQTQCNICYIFFKVSLRSPF